MERKREQAAQPPDPIDEPANASMPRAAGPPLGVDSRDGSVNPGCQVSDERREGSIGQIQADDEWRRWLAENLLVGESVERIIEAMELRGFSREEIVRELKAAEDSPYLKGSLLLRDRIKKREWLLTAYRQNHRLHPASAEIERRHRLTRNELLRDYYSTNRPVIITGMLDDWPAMRTWSLEYFARTLGERQVDVRLPRVTDANKDTGKYEQFVGRTSFGEFVEKMRAGGASDNCDLTAHFGSANRKSLSPLWDEIGQIPEYLATDRPGCILKMMPQGSATPFHHELANILMAQVLGRTRLQLVPSWDIPFVFNDFHWFSRVYGPVLPSPSYMLDDAQIHDVILEPTEVLFLPVGWLHYVEAIEASVTVTFTNFIFDNDFASSYTTYGPV